MTANDHQTPHGGADAAIVHPVKGKNSPNPGSFAMMVSNAADLRRLAEKMPADFVSPRNLLMSRFFCPADTDKDGALVGPVIGAPYAVMLFENLIAWGVRRLLFFGWGGGISPGIEIGDVVLVSGAIADEGTSRHYGRKEHAVIRSSQGLTRKISAALKTGGLDFHQGLVWTTDAIFRETGQELIKFQKAGALAVEMELSALFSVARFRGVEMAGVLVISDELTSLKWRPGFGHPRFKQTRCNLCEVLAGFWPSLQEE